MVFRDTPGATVSVVVGENDVAAKLRLWAGADRTQVRFLLDELSLIPVAEGEYRANFRASYMAEGMRSDRGELYARNVPARQTWILARKKIGCFVVLLQPLLGGRLKIHLRLHDPQG